VAPKGLCHEFGSQINSGCDHPMRAGASACSCPECGVVCQGLFDGCADVWARGPRPVTIAATRAVSGAGPATPAAASSDAGNGRPAQPTLAPAGARRANGNRGGNRARVQAAASFGKTDLPSPEPAEADPRREMFRWFEEAFVGVRSDLQTLIASMTHQQAMLAELIDSRQAELRLVLAAETLPDIVADAVAGAMSAHTEAMTESFSTALGTFREEMDKSQAGTAATVDNLRETFDTFLNALAVHDDGAEKREAARLRTVKGSITRQLAPLTEAVALLNAQAEGSRPPRRQPAPAKPPSAMAEPADADDEPAVPAARSAQARPPAARPSRAVTGSDVPQPRPSRVVTGAQVKAAQAKPGSAPQRGPRVVTGPGVKTATAAATTRRAPAKPIPKAVADQSPLLRTIRSSRNKP
jgi:hypothetical protein